jgi:hypothetical protein
MLPSGGSRRASRAIARTIRERTPRMIPGVTLVLGKAKPVRLVRIVVTRNTPFQGLRSLPLIRPKRTMKPVPIPMRLMRTCRVV